MSKINIFWFRRDLRLHDNAGLYHALKSGQPVLPLFIFDKNILDKLSDKKDARVHFIFNEIKRLSEELIELGSALIVKYGFPQEIWESLLKEYSIENVFTNHDYEPYAFERDQEIKKIVEAENIGFHTFKDHVIFENKEVVKDDRTPYTVFTPYSRKWKDRLNSKIVQDKDGNNISFYLKAYPTENYFDNFLKIKQKEIPSLNNMGFEKTDLGIPDKTVTQGLIKNYGKTRDYPAIKGTSRLGIHFRFGTISIREKARKALGLSEVFLNELIWRDFYAMILSNFPHVATGPFRPQYKNIEWRNNEKEFKAWCEGKTGYPLVDAGMRELNNTGYMHNRVRMVVASFLTKHLLINWQWGEAYFAEKLLDFDLASNSGGWQWAAGCGTDAAPYFRIFNPTSQLEKFDKELKYVKKWIPEYGTNNYPKPIVEHKMARERCLEVYKTALK
ncbi:MAG: deoxyribodipyrimidine photo-lyase [Saprospiraceae bacterium]